MFAPLESIKISILPKIFLILIIFFINQSCEDLYSKKNEQQNTKSSDNITVTTEKGWELVWNDEFEADDLDLKKWEFEENCWGGGNNELQCYTSRSENLFIQNGYLIIRAKKETFTGPSEPIDWNSNAPDKSLPYTSARIRTKNKGDWRYGRFEVRALLPEGKGIWPAIWMLPTESKYGGWAASGEIDIMEAINLGTSPKKEIHGTLHYGGIWPNNVHSGTSYTFEESDPNHSFHTYAIEWSDHEIRWYVDEIHYATQEFKGWYTSPESSNVSKEEISENAPFDEEFHLLINLAVGGNWPGSPDTSTSFPVELLVDYVRIYECAESINSLSSCESVDNNAILVKGHQEIETNTNKKLLSDGNGKFVIFDNQSSTLFFKDVYSENGEINIIEKNDSQRGTILQIEFNTNNSLIFWKSKEKYDLSDYTFIEFDLKLINDPRENGNFKIKMECGYPCGSRDFNINKPNKDWSSYKVDLRDLVLNQGSDLDLKSVDAPLVIFPDWGNQNGVVMQIDNIRLTK
tara:strand:- start:36 stop:1589 length:1554 start_codon:yes stop_codon:yes gene_type:complete